MTLPRFDRSADLARPRLALHHAAAIPSELGFTWLPHDDGFRFSNLGWDGTLGALLSHEVDGLQAGLRLAEGSWILARDGAVIDQLAVAGSTLDGARAWLRAGATSQGLEDRDIVTADWDLPGHEVLDGAPFPTVSPSDRGEIAAWFAFADAALREIEGSFDGASAVRAWPHHFDIATLITLDPDRDAEEARSVGVGLSPGDGGIAEPYFYVTPWPVPETTSQPELPSGGWHTEGWFGAVLRGTTIARFGSSDATVRAFLRSAIDASLGMLPAGD